MTIVINEPGKWKFWRSSTTKAALSTIKERIFNWNRASNAERNFALQNNVEPIWRKTQLQLTSTDPHNLYVIFKLWNYLPEHFRRQRNLRASLTYNWCLGNGNFTEPNSPDCTANMKWNNMIEEMEVYDVADAPSGLQQGILITSSTVYDRPHLILTVSGSLGTKLVNFVIHKFFEYPAIKLKRIENHHTYKDRKLPYNSIYTTTRDDGPPKFPVNAPPGTNSYFPKINLANSTFAAPTVANPKAEKPKINQ